MSNRGHNGGFDPFRDARGRWATGPASASRPPGEPWAVHENVAVHSVSDAQGSRYEIWDGDTHVHSYVATRANWREARDAANTHARQLAAASAPAPAPRPAPTPAPAPAAPVAWKPRMTPAEADRWGADSVLTQTFAHSVRSRELYRMKDIEQKGFKAEHEGTHGAARWGSGIYLAFDGEKYDHTRPMYEEWMESGKTFQTRVNVKRPYTITIGSRDEPDPKQWLPKDRHDDFDARVKAAYNRQWPIGQRQPSNFRYNTRTPYWVFKDILKEYGYDALIIDGGGIATGGHQLLVFDPKNVTIVGEEPFDHGPYEPNDLL